MIPKFKISVRVTPPQRVPAGQGERERFETLVKACVSLGLIEIAP